MDNKFSSSTFDHSYKFRIHSQSLTLFSLVRLQTLGDCVHQHGILTCSIGTFGNHAFQLLASTSYN